MSTAPAPHTIVVIPCSAAKMAEATTARELYAASPNFNYSLTSAMNHAAETAKSERVTTEVMILSAKHGLIGLDEVLAPYDTKMGQEGSIAPAALAAQLEKIGAHRIEAMLPSKYRVALAKAVEINNDNEDTTWIEFLDVFEAAPGIGYQRGVWGSLNSTGS